MRYPTPLLVFVFLLYVSGFAAILLWTCSFQAGSVGQALLQRQLSLGASATYMSENALAPQSIASYVRDADLARARLWTSVLAARPPSGDSGDVSDALAAIAQHLVAGFPAPRCYGNCSVVTLRVPAPRSDGTECLILGASLYAADRPPGRDAISAAGMALALAEFLLAGSPAARSRDVVVVLYAAQRQAHAMQQWFDLYLAGRITEASFIRAGLFLDWPALTTPSDLLIVYDGVDSELPNLDLINTITRLVPGSTLDTSPPASPVGRLTAWLDERVGQSAALQQLGVRLQPAQLNALLTFLSKQAQRLPAQLVHPLFNHHHIDAVTLRARAGDQRPHARAGRFGWASVAFAVEGTLHALSNIIEHLHQSFYFYLLLSPDAYVSIGTYVLALALIAAPLPLHYLRHLVLSTDAADRPALAAVVLALYTYGVAVAAAPTDWLPPAVSLLLPQRCTGAALSTAVGLLIVSAVRWLLPRDPDPALRRSLIVSLAGIVPILCLLACALVNYALALFWTSVIVSALVLPSFLLRDAAPRSCLLFALLAASPVAVAFFFGELPLLFSLYLPFWLASIFSLSY